MPANLTLFFSKPSLTRKVLFIVLFFIPIILSISDIIFHNSVFSLFSELICSNVCHQNPAKVLTTENGKILVCSRCFGIYFGFAIGIIFWKLKELLKSIRIKHILSGFAAILFDSMAVSVFHLYSYSHLIAFLTGFSFGFPLILFLIRDLDL